MVLGKHHIGRLLNVLNWRQGGMLVANVENGLFQRADGVFGLLITLLMRSLAIAVGSRY